MDFKNVLQTALQQAGVDNLDQVISSIEDDSDLFALLRLADLAGGQQLLRNRIRPPYSVYCLKPALFMRRRRYEDDAQITFPNIENDPRCEQMQLIPVTSERYAFSQLHFNRFDHLYRKSYFPPANKLAQLNKQSSLNLAWQCLDAPHADFMKQQAGYIRKEVMTATIQDIKPEDFGELMEPYNFVQVKYFLYIKYQIINLLHTESKNIDELFSKVYSFVEFSYQAQKSIVIDWGKAVQYVFDMTVDYYLKYISRLKSGYPQSEASEDTTPAIVKESLIADKMINSNNSELKNSVVDLSSQPDMRDFVGKAKTAILEEMANFDEVTQDMTPDEKNNIYYMYLDKLRYIRELEVKLDEEDPQKSYQDFEAHNAVERSISYQIVEVDVDYAENAEYPQAYHSKSAPYAIDGEEQQDARSNSLASNPIEEMGDPEEDYDELSDSGQHEEYMKVIANSPAAYKTPLRDLQDALINSEPVLVNEDELHEIADYQLEPDADPDAKLLLLKAQPDSHYLSYVQLVRGRVQAEVPKLPVNAFVDYQKCFRDLPLPEATHKGIEMARQIHEKIDQMRSKEYLTSIYNYPYPSTHISNSNLRVYYDPLRTGSVVLPQNLEEEAEVPFAEGEVICGRYQLIKMCGQATFSNCFSAIDLKENKKICLKIIKNDKEFLDQALDEIHLLELIRELDKGEENRVITIKDYFYFREHLLMVFNLYGEDLFIHCDRLQQQHRPSDYSLPVIKDIALQLLRAFDFIHRLGICHLDAKPENVLHVSPTFAAGYPADVKLVDLGSSSYLFDKIHQYIQSRSYRCPEIIFGLPYDTRSDIWSIGAILGELLTGYVLFPNHSVATMLARINALLSPIPRNFILSGRASNKYLTGGLVSFEEENGRFATLCPEQGLLEAWLFEETKDLGEEELLFGDFVRYMLTVDYMKRPTAEMLLQHFWLKQNQTYIQ